MNASVFVCVCVEVRLSLMNCQESVSGEWDSDCAS